MVYLYGLSEAHPDALQNVLQGMPGLEAPVELTHIGDWVVLHSAHTTKEVMPKRRLLLAHTKVLEAALTCGTILPARFGLVASSFGEVAKLINVRHQVISDQFEKVRDAIEIGVRVSYDKEAAIHATLQSDSALMAKHKSLQKAGPEARFAIAEFGGKLADHLDRRRGQTQKKLLSNLLRLCHAHVLRKPEDDTEVLRAEFLVGAAQQDAFQQAVIAAASTQDFAPGAEPQIEIIGPVPMYNFVNLNLTFDHEQAAA